MKIQEAIVTKVTPSGKSIYVGVKASKYQTGYEFGWCANPDGLKKGDLIKDFNPTGRVPMVKEDGPMLHENGEPVMAFTFM